MGFRSYFGIACLQKKRRQLRRLRVETLEGRQLLAADIGLEYSTPEPPAMVDMSVVASSQTQCDNFAYDVNNDGWVSPYDALLVINQLNRYGVSVHTPFHNPDFVWYDVNFDELVTPLDALLVINQLNRKGTHAFEFGCGVQTASMAVVEKSLTSTDVIVENQKSITGVRFAARASEVDQLLTQVTIEVEQGFGQDAQNGTLWFDTDGDQAVDTILQSGVIAQQGQFTFDHMVGGGIVLSADEEFIFEFRFDASSALTGTELQFGLSDVASERLDDLSAVEDITVIGGDSTVFAPVQQGDLFVLQDSTPVRSQYLLGGELGAPVIRLNARAQNESVLIEKLHFTTLVGAGSIDRLELFLDNATTPFGVATLNGCGAESVPAGTFCFTTNDPTLVIPEGSDVDIVVRPRVKNDNAGGTSGDKVQFALTHVEAQGLDSSNPLLQNNGDGVATGEIFIGTNVPGPNNPVSGPEHTVVMAKVTSVVNANPDADGVIVPTGIAPTGQFSITAGAHNNSDEGLNDVLTDLLTFVITTNEVELDTNGFTLYNKADSSSVTSDADVVDLGNGSYEVTFSGLAASLVNTEIDNGASETFVFSTNVLSAGPNASLEVSLLTDEAVWLDQDAGGFVSYQGFKLVDPVVKSTMYRN